MQHSTVNPKQPRQNMNSQVHVTVIEHNIIYHINHVNEQEIPPRQDRTKLTYIY